MPFTNWLSNDANRKSEPGTKLAEKEEKNNYNFKQKKNKKQKKGRERQYYYYSKENSMLFSPYIAPTIKNGFKTD